ncbi:hypothetical protein PPZ62_11620 [Aquirufa nivalisilvae]
MRNSYLLYLLLSFGFIFKAELAMSFVPQTADTIRINREVNLGELKLSHEKIKLPTFQDKKSNQKPIEVPLNWSSQEEHPLKWSKINPRDGEVFGLDSLNNNIIRVGAGSFGYTYLNLNLNKADQRLGFYLSHDAYAEGPVADIFSQKKLNNIKVWSRSRADSKLELETHVAYSQLGTNYYGFEPGQKIPSFRDQRLVYDTYNFFGKFGTNIPRSTFDFNASIDVSRISNLSGISELTSNGSFYSKIKLKSNSFINLSGEMILSEYKTPAMTLTRSFSRLRPFYTFSNYFVTVSAGAHFLQETSDGPEPAKTSFFPQFLIDFSSLDYIHFFAGLGGDVQFNTYANFVKQNPWVAPNILLKNSSQVGNLYAGIKGTNRTDKDKAGDIDFELKIAYSEYTDLPIITNSTIDPTQFVLSYVGGLKKVQVTTFSGNFDLQVSRSIKSAVRFNYDSYESLGDLEKAFHRPAWKVNWNGTILLGNKLSVIPTIEYINGLYAWSPTELKVKAMDEIFDLNCHINFNFNEKVALGVNLNNLLNRNFQRYLNYPSLGYNFGGVLTYSF